MISVCLCVYLTKENSLVELGYLNESIQSILDQTFTDLELVIVDDSSEIDLESHIRSNFNDPRIKYFRNETNLGIGDCRKVAILRTSPSSTYVAFQDHDDISKPERLEVLYNYLETHKDIDIVGCQYRFINSTNHEIGRELPYYKLDNDDIKRDFFTHYGMHITSSLAKKEIFNDVDTLSIKYEDFLLWYQWIDKYKFANVPDVLFHYRIRDNQITEDNTTYGEVKAILIPLMESKLISLGYLPDPTNSEYLKGCRRTVKMLLDLYNTESATYKLFNMYKGELSNLIYKDQ